MRAPVVASIAAMDLASVATAVSGSAAKSYKASLAAVNPAATTAGLATVVGKAQLVDGKKKNKVSLHVRNLAAGNARGGRRRGSVRRRPLARPRDALTLALQADRRRGRDFGCVRSISPTPYDRVWRGCAAKTKTVGWWS